MKHSLLYLLTVFLFFTYGKVYPQTTIEEIIGDMTLNHEGRPHGVPTSFNWSIKPRAGAVEPPADWTAAIAWGQLYEWTEGNPATNTRVQIKDLELYYLSKVDHKWHLLQKSAKVGGANYIEDFHDDLNKPADIRYPSDGGVSVTCGGGYNFHFWPTAGRVKFPANEVAGCFVTVKARLILDDPTGNDDRDSAKFVLSVGGDWWLSLTAQWDQWTTNADMGIGRFRFVTPEWKSYSMFSVPADTIVNNPPPFPSVSTRVYTAPANETGNLILEKNYPNPFSGSTHINFFLPETGYVSLAMLDFNGKTIGTLLEGNALPGSHKVELNAAAYKPGNYLILLKSNGETRTIKCQIIR